MEKLFYSLNDALRAQFGEKVIKLSLDGGFTCPNRDGTLDRRGCIFCSADGSGEFAGSRSLSIREQQEAQIRLLHGKWPNAKYIAYFQNFTNTYAPLDRLRTLYDEALSDERMVGLAIATRPDCLSEDIIELLAQYHRRVFLWVELGLQSTKEETARLIRRGYALPIFDSAMLRLNARGIRTVAHLIVDLPNESFEDIRESVAYVCRAGVWGIKLQMLNILKGTDLAARYVREPFALYTADEYIACVSHLLAYTAPQVVIHRLTGDGDKKSLLAPQWVRNKRYILNGIRKYMSAHELYQGKLWSDAPSTAESRSRGSQPITE